MGVVYRACRDETTDLVALKTIRLVEQRLIGSFRREVQALASLDHPGVVRVRDSGLADGLPWYAMDLVDGVSLRQCMASGTPRHTHTLAMGDAVSEPPRDAPRTVREQLSIIQRLCWNLAFIHGEGIVHRDLKPENILIPDTGWPVLVDFGITARFGARTSRESLDVLDTAVGTLAYASPEQLLGQFVDARADLYSLGCILYEVVTGRVPFRGNRHAVALAHVERHPEPPSRWADVPPGLEDLIMRLLEKAPRQRIGHADTVAALLAPFCDGAPEPTQSGRPYLYRPALSGRDTAVERLAGLIDAAILGDGAVALVNGESGCGKTRLLMEVAANATASGCTVLAGECQPSSAVGAEAYTPALQGLRGPLLAIADRCREKGLAETERLLGHRGPTLALFEPSLAGLPGQNTYPPPADLPAPAFRLRLLEYLYETFAALAEAVPVVVIIDDLHWGDDLTIAFVEHVVRRGSPRRLALLVAARREELGERLPNLIAQGLTSVELEGLDLPAVSTIVGDMLGMAPPPARFSGFLASESEGNPFFIGEYVQAAVDLGMLWRDQHGDWQIGASEDRDASDADYRQLGLPRTIQELVARRLDGLPGAALAVAYAASALGREFDAALLRRMTGLDETAFEQAVAEMRRRRVLEDGKGESLRFAHSKVGDVAYSRLDPQERSRLHRAVADAMGPLDENAPAELLGELGRHSELAGDFAAARRCYSLGWAKARNRFALNEQERLIRAYLRVAPADDAECHRMRNSLAFSVLLPQGRLAEALDELRAALEIARRAGAREAEEMLTRTWGILHWHTGNLDEALRAYDEALAIGRQIGDRRGEGQTLTNVAFLHFNRGDLGAARDTLKRAIALHREGGNRISEAIALGNLGLVEYAAGNRAESERLHLLALDVARETQELQVMGMACSKLANLALERGDAVAARELADAAMRYCEEAGNLRHMAEVCYDKANIDRRLGDHDTAERGYRRSEELFRTAGADHGLVHVFAGLARLALARGRLAEVDESIALARAYAARYGSWNAEATKELAAAEAAAAVARTGQVLPTGDLPNELTPEFIAFRGLTGAG